jgi:Tol biopolymer transport system component
MLGVLTAYFPIYLYANEPHRNEPLVEEIIGSNLGEVIFDSNRAGNFSIYTYHLKSNKLYRVTNSSKHDMFPDPSPDKSHLVFSRHSSLKRGTPSEIIILSLKDKSENIIDSGAFPTFSLDGEKIFYEKDRSKVYSYSIKDKSVREIFPNNNKSFTNYQIVKPRLSPDNSKLVFTSDKGGRWHAWLIDLTNNEEIKIGHGCEPVFHPIENKIIWVGEKNMKERSGFKYFNLEDKTTGIFHDLDAPWGHEYFPSFSRDGKKLIYSASPPNEHSHEHANYQIFIKNLKSEEIQRITEDGFTNRWGKFLGNN